MCRFPWSSLTSPFDLVGLTLFFFLRLFGISWKFISSDIFESSCCKTEMREHLIRDKCRAIFSFTKTDTIFFYYAMVCIKVYQIYVYIDMLHVMNTKHSIAMVDLAWTKLYSLDHNNNEKINKKSKLIFSILLEHRRGWGVRWHQRKGYVSYNCMTSGATMHKQQSASKYYPGNEISVFALWRGDCRFAWFIGWFPDDIRQDCYRSSCRTA